MTTVSKSSVSLAVLAVFLASSAYSADIYGQGSTKDAPGVLDAPTSGGAFSWTGFYIQGQAGVGNDNHALDLRTKDKDPKWDDLSILSLDGLSLDGLSSAGFVGGGRVGFDYARGRFLAGVFGSYNFSSQETELGLLTGFGGPVFTVEKQDEWDVGVRLGYIVAPKTLAYVLAAYTETSYEINGPAGKIADQDFSGVSVGGGVEFAFTQYVFFGVEYAHTFYQDEDWLDDKSLKLIDNLDSDKAMATLKIKLNAGVPGLAD
jgi:outer membrane immunogenic protein